MPEPEWSIVPYTEGGRSPVAEFIEGLDAKTRGRIAWSLEQLRMRNVRARKPLVDHVEGKVWELREASRTNIYRILYFMASGRRIVLLHAFQKKTQKTPQREIETARRRMENLIASEGDVP